MKPKTLILMVVAVTCGLGASWMTSRLLAERGQEAAPETVDVLVAKAELNISKPLKNPEELFEVKAWLKETAPKNAVTKFEELKNRQLKRALRPGDFVTPEDLLGDKESFMQNHLPPGHQALGIRVNMESIAGGWASLPLSRVDILLTARRGSDKDSFSMTLLENVLVLAVDQTAWRTETGNAMPGNVVTVALTPEDTHKITLGRELGSLTMALRPMGDHKKGTGTKLTVEELLAQIGGKKNTEIQEEAKTKTPQLPALPTVEKKGETPKVEVAQVEQPKGTRHVLKIWEGDRQRTVEYWLNEDGQVIEPDVVRSELQPQSPPRPPQVQTPETPAAPPAPPAPPKNEKAGN